MTRASSVMKAASPLIISHFVQFKDQVLEKYICLYIYIHIYVEYFIDTVFSSQFYNAFVAGFYPGMFTHGEYWIFVHGQHLDDILSTEGHNSCYLKQQQQQQQLLPEKIFHHLLFLQQLQFSKHDLIFFFSSSASLHLSTTLLQLYLDSVGIISCFLAPYIYIYKLRAHSQIYV